MKGGTGISGGGYKDREGHPFSEVSGDKNLENIMESRRGRRGRRGGKAFRKSEIACRKRLNWQGEPIE